MPRARRSSATDEHQHEHDHGHDCGCTRATGEAEHAHGVPFVQLSEEERYRVAMAQLEADPFLGALIAAVREMDAAEAAAAEAAAPAPEQKKRTRKSDSPSSTRKASR